MKMKWKELKDKFDACEKKGTHRIHHYSDPQSGGWWVCDDCQTEFTEKEINDLKIYEKNSKYNISVQKLNM